MDCSLSIGKKGWFEEASPWQSIVKGGARQTSSRILRGNLLMEEIFGDKEHQEKWVKWWDKNLHILKGSENPLTVNKKAFSMMARQAAVINFYEDLSSSGIIPALADRLHFFHACVYRLPGNTASEAWKIGGSPEGFYRPSADEFIPVFSQEMHDIVMSDLFSPSSKYNQEANKRFRSHAQKQLLTNQISSAQESTPAKKIKM